MHFTRLRISGFKSFVEPTEVMIEPGLTGVVGPNGCGKSNLVEALRWAMGETSAKQLRGGAMDDVIFAGTASRPARNLAEVTLCLDNAERRATAQFNDADELEISRQIQRDSGSTYRINGREVRARDVQLLFADMATGAHSTALVSQGRVGALINAKPTERRHLLEEAAGITGLHSRRHEAELRLRAAETNLERLDDVVASLEGQLQALKRQARQASRYRNISTHIRKAEASLLHLRWTAASGALATAREKLAEAEAAVVEQTRRAAEAARLQAEAAGAVAPLRHAEAEAAAALHRLGVARETLDAEEQRTREALTQLRQRLQQIADDTVREERRQADAGEGIALLDREADEIAAARQGEQEAQIAAAETVDEAQRTVNARQAVLDEITERVAAGAAQRQNLARQAADAERRIARFRSRLDDIARQRAALEAELADPTNASGASPDIEGYRKAGDDAHGKAEKAERRRLEAQGEEAQARDALQTAESAAAKLRAEERALAELAAVHDNDIWPPLIDALTVEQGYEAALGAALGDDLDVPADEAAPVHWSTLEPYAAPAPLPEGARPLSDFVTAPTALTRRLSQIGVIDAADGATLMHRLAQGQRLVSRDGGLWRWDGYVAGAGGATAAATRLAQRNRLDEVRRDLTRADAALTKARTRFEQARAKVREAATAETEAREAARQADRRLREFQDAQAKAVAADAARRSRLAALLDAAEQAQTELAEAQAQDEEARTALENLPAEDLAREEQAAIRQEVEGLRARLAEARSALDAMRRDAAVRIQRLQRIAGERKSWENRAADAALQIDALRARREQASGELAALEGRPEEIAAQRGTLLDQITAAEARRDKAADAVAEAETMLAARDRALREANRELGEIREHRARLEADVEHAAEHLEELRTRIREQLDCLPEEVLAAGEIPPGEELPAVDIVEKRLERLRKERDNMGPVNLRAEIEAAEVTEQLETMLTEKGDLEAAIAKLRHGISSLNREGRQRLLDAFKKVDEHFQHLFVRMFGGGKAHLALTESDDPLQAGLEIMASPPGKKLQIMSLLSGGEQALTALSLLFAVFLTNPAPICVLDEVDAPLDDANVERLCRLLEEMARSGSTRFLAVTHNPITMAHMDRLFGVTMAERGISQLVSVDLQAAVRLRESA